MDDEIDRKIDVTAILFLLVQNRQQTHDLILNGSGANGLGIQECVILETLIYLTFERYRVTKSVNFCDLKNKKCSSLFRRETANV